MVDDTHFKLTKQVSIILILISSFSNLYAHTATESLISMIYDDNDNPFDMNELAEFRIIFKYINKVI